MGITDQEELLLCPLCEGEATKISSYMGARMARCIGDNCAMERSGPITEEAWQALPRSDGNAEALEVAAKIEEHVECMEGYGKLFNLPDTYEVMARGWVARLRGIAKMKP